MWLACERDLQAKRKKACVADPLVGDLRQAMPKRNADATPLIPSSRRRPMVSLPMVSLPMVSLPMVSFSGDQEGES